MRLGLYSELAWQSVVKARDIIAKESISSNKNDMSTFRQHIIDGKYSALGSLARANDFYATSELRDFLFHVQEHRFKVPQIKNILNDLGLIFIGFEFSRDEIINSFKREYPEQDAIYDLDNWHRFETLNPITFQEMYQFWVQKPNDL